MEKVAPSERFRSELDEVLAGVGEEQDPATRRVDQPCGCRKLDLRMIKIQQKISGCWRTTTEADRLLALLAYISTTRKQVRDTIDALARLAKHQPWLPAGAESRPANSDLNSHGAADLSRGGKVAACGDVLVPPGGQGDDAHCAG
jgi:hypothetical protein